MNNKKTLIFYNPSFENGGVERNIINIIENKIINKKYNIILLSIIGKYNNLTISQNKIPNIFNYFVFSRIARYFICSIYLFTYCLTKKCTVISFQNNILAIIITKLTFNKIILRLNTSPEKYINNEISRKFFTFFYKMSDNIVCNSHDFKKSINKFFNIGSVVINNFLNFKKILSLSKKNIPKNFFRNKKKIRLINCGRIVYQKNQILILKSLKYLNFDYELFIIGSGKLYNDLNSYIIKNKLEKKARIMPHSQNPYKYISKADIFILSSIFEGMPNVLLEAGYLKTLIVSSDCPTGPREIINNGINGYIFKNNNKLDLAKKLNMAFKKNLINKKKIKNMFKYVRKNYNEHNMNKFIRIIEKIS